MGGQGNHAEIAKQAQADQEPRNTPATVQDLEELAARLDHEVSKEIAESFSSAWQQGQQQDNRITELEDRCFKLEGQTSDLGFRIADHDSQLNNSGLAGTAKRWPVVTSQILAALFNAVVILPAAVWDYLPQPWPFVVGAILQSVAAVIGGQFTESKAALARLQDGQRVAPLTQEDRVREDWRNRFTPPLDEKDKAIPPVNAPPQGQIDYHNRVRQQFNP